MDDWSSLFVSFLLQHRAIHKPNPVAPRLDSSQTCEAKDPSDIVSGSSSTQPSVSIQPPTGPTPPAVHTPSSFPPPPPSPLCGRQILSPRPRATGFHGVCTPNFFAPREFSHTIPVVFSGCIPSTARWTTKPVARLSSPIGYSRRIGWPRLPTARAGVCVGRRRRGGGLERLASDAAMKPPACSIFRSVMPLYWAFLNYQYLRAKDVFLGVSLVV